MSGDRTVVGEALPRQQSAAHKAVDRLASYGLDELHYYITTSRDKFDVKKVFEKLGAKGQQTCHATVLPKDRSTDYHVHVSIGIAKEEINIHLVYFEEEGNPHEHTSGDGGDEVGAEDFMEWLGRFFKHETCQTHIHAHYVYLLASRQCKFPLPLKTSLGGDAEIDGISVRLPREPENVSKVRVTQGKELWFVEMIADRRIAFKKFALYGDVRALASVLDSLMEERKA